MCCYSIWENNHQQLVCSAKAELQNYLAKHWQLYYVERLRKELTIVLIKSSLTRQYFFYLWVHLNQLPSSLLGALIQRIGHFKFCLNFKNAPYKNPTSMRTLFPYWSRSAWKKVSAELMTSTIVKSLLSLSLSNDCKL